MRLTRLLVFDGDDTLWVSEPLYDRARAAAAQIVGGAGVDPVEWEKLQRQLDVINVQRFGLSPKRFPTSCREAYEQLRIRDGLPLDEANAERVYTVAAGVFDAEAELMPDANQVLKALAGRSYLVLLTKGDEAVQKRRVRDSGLEAYFDEVCIVDRKTPETFAVLARRFGVPPERCWSIGNSLASDISPAVAAGWHAAWIDAHVWEHERRQTEPASDSVVSLERLGYVVDLILEDATEDGCSEL